MKYEIGEDGILRQVDDGTPSPSPIKPPSQTTTTRRPTTTTTTQTTTTRRPTTTTTTTRPTTTTTTTPHRPVTTTRRRVDFANIMYNASWIMIVFGVGAAAALAAQNYQLGVGFAAYFERLWYNITSAWSNLDPFFGFSVVVDELSFIPSLPSLGSTFLEIVDYLILGGGWFALLTSSIRWLFSTIIPLVRIIFEAWGMLFRLLFGFLL